MKYDGIIKGVENASNIQSKTLLDLLTGLGNKHKFEQRLKEICADKEIRIATETQDNDKKDNSCNNEKTGNLAKQLLQNNTSHNTSLDSDSLKKTTAKVKIIHPISMI